MLCPLHSLMLLSNLCAFFFCYLFSPLGQRIQLFPATYAILSACISVLEVTSLV